MTLGESYGMACGGDACFTRTHIGMHLYRYPIGIFLFKACARCAYHGFVLGMHGYERARPGEDCIKGGVVVDEHVAGRRAEEEFYSRCAGIVGVEKFGEIAVGGSEEKSVVGY